MSSPALAPVVAQPLWLPPATPSPAPTRSQPSPYKKKEEEFKKVENLTQHRTSIYSVVYIFNNPKFHSMPITLKNKTSLLVSTTEKSRVSSLVGRITYTGSEFSNIKTTSVMEWFIFQFAWRLAPLELAARRHVRNTVAGCVRRWSPKLSRDNG